MTHALFTQILQHHFPGLGVDKANTIAQELIDFQPSYFDIVFDGEPGQDGPIFIETEDPQGKSFKAGNWVKRDDDYWVLRIPRDEVTSKTSDGHHTFEELYDYRMVYNAIAAEMLHKAGLITVHKSWNHDDGKPCFGGGWFVVKMNLPIGQVSNHYKSQYWDLFNIPEVVKAMPYDGHTPAEALARLKYFAQFSVKTGKATRAKVPQPTDEYLMRLVRSYLPPEVESSGANEEPQTRYRTSRSADKDAKALLPALRLLTTIQPLACEEHWSYYCTKCKADQ